MRAPDRTGLRAIVDAVRAAPLVSQYRRAKFVARFRNDPGAHLFLGTYASFADAAAAAPPTKPLGYDNPEAAAMYDARLDRVHAADYPVLYWLHRIGPVSGIVDFGGHVGVAYYAFRPYLEHQWHDVTWTVIDVPAVVARGEALALSRGARALRFSVSSALEQADVWMAAGSLHYVEDQPSAIISRMRRPPRYVLLNKVPLTDGDSYVTLNSIGTAFCPYAVRNRDAFERDLTDAGYVVRDRWRNEELSCTPFDAPSRAVQGYSGMLLERVA